MTRYIVVSIGCLECGEESDLLEANTDRTRALGLGAAFPGETGFPGWGGMGMVVAFPIPEEDR